MNELLTFLRDFVTVLWAMRAAIIAAAFVFVVLLWMDEVTRARRAERALDRLWQENDDLRRKLRDRPVLVVPRSRPRRPIVMGRDQ